jgi:hypothetical protein
MKVIAYVVLFQREHIYSPCDDYRKIEISQKNNSASFLQKRKAGAVVQTLFSSNAALASYRPMPK